MSQPSLDRANAVRAVRKELRRAIAQAPAPAEAAASAIRRPTADTMGMAIDAILSAVPYLQGRTYRAWVIEAGCLPSDTIGGMPSILRKAIAAELLTWDQVRHARQVRREATA